MKELYKFEGLKLLLESRGYNVSPNKRIIIKKDFAQSLKSHKVKFSGNHIVSIDDNGNEHITYVYMQNYYVNYRGTPKFPKFHLTNCSTIQQYITDGTFKDKYILANTKTCDVKDRYTGRIYKGVNLHLCSYCQRMLNKTSDNDISDTDDFYRKYGGENEVVELDVKGYTMNWNILSRKYRENKNYICESCGIDLTKYKRLLDVHHKDGNKTNNSKDNLIALCVECHSKIDARHKENFQSKINQDRLKQLMAIKNK